MPSVTAIRQAYELKDGSVFSSAYRQRGKATIEHIVEKEFELYVFPVKLTIACVNKSSSHATEEKVRKVLKDHLKGAKLIYSDMGSPYDTTLSTDIAVEKQPAQPVRKGWGKKKKDDEGKGEGGDGKEVSYEYHCSFTLSAVRKAGMQTVAQQSREIEPKKPDGIPDDMKCMRSKYDKSICGSCGEQIRAGRYIVQKEDKKWIHATCYVGQGNKVMPSASDSAGTGAKKKKMEKEGDIKKKKPAGKKGEVEEKKGGVKKAAAREKVPTARTRKSIDPAKVDSANNRKRKTADSGDSNDGKAKNLPRADEKQAATTTPKKRKVEPSTKSKKVEQTTTTNKRKRAVKKEEEVVSQKRAPPRRSARSN